MAFARGSDGDDDRVEHDDGAPMRQPGHELADARERRGIDRAQMAARLHLPERQLEALEGDDYQQLPPPAFVRGYLRAYAREAGLDGDDIVAAYDALGAAAEDPDIRPVERSSRAASARARTASLIVLIGVVAAAFGGWLWQSRQGAGDPGAIVSSEDPSGSVTTDADDPPADETAPESGQASTSAASEGDGGAGTDAADGASGGGGAGDSADAAQASTAAAHDAATGDTAAATNDATPTASVADSAEESAPEVARAGASTGDSGDADDTTTAATNQSPAASGEIAADDGGDNAAPAGDAEGGEASGDTAGAEPAYDPPSATGSPEQATAPAAGEGPDTLELEVAGRSWIEVYDGRGRQLVYTLYTGDAPLRLRGWAPFDVFLGNSPDVRIRYEGEAVTKSAFTRSDETARFLVDADGARRR